jgi:hypothetical protein
MAYEEQRVVTNDPAVAPADEVVTRQPDTVVERRVAEPVVERQVAPTRRVVTDDPVGNAYAASQLIQTIVWSVVVLVLLVVALLALHVYLHLF